MKMLLKLWKNESRRPTIRYSTKTQRIAQLLASALFQKAYLKVSYGKMKDNFGKQVEFYNDGEYFHKGELRKAFRTFIHQEI